MGGTSLAPDVLAHVVRHSARRPVPVDVLDSTDPDAVRAATAASDRRAPLYLIASKSGTTTETLAFLAYFWDARTSIQRDIPRRTPATALRGRSPIPAPSLNAIPHIDLFREVFLNPADVGGRYSALSYVGPGARRR